MPLAILIVILVAVGVAAPQAAAEDALPTPPARPLGPEVVLPHLWAPSDFDVFSDGSAVVIADLSDDFQPYAQLLDTDLQPLGEPMRLPTQRLYFGNIDMVALDGHRWAVAHLEADCPDECDLELFLSIYDGYTPVALRIPLDQADNFFFEMAADADGKLLVAWTRRELEFNGTTTTYHGDTRGRLFDHDGVAQGEDFILNDDPRRKTLETVEFLADGSLVAVWQVQTACCGSDLRYRRFQPSGQVDAERPLHDQTANNQSRVDLAANAVGGGFVAAWADCLPSSASPSGCSIMLGEVGEDDGLAPPRRLTPTPEDDLASRLEPHVERSAGHLVVTWDAFSPGAPDGAFVDGTRALAFHGERTLGPYLVAPFPSANYAVTHLRAVGPGEFLAFYSGYQDTRLPEASDEPYPFHVAKLRRLAAGPCRGLCLGNGDGYEAAVVWQLEDGRQGGGHPVEHGEGWGTFWFFRPDNVEMAVKVLDGRPVNGHRWVFTAGLSDVAHALDVYDLEGGEARRYDNRHGVIASRGDTTAFPVPAGQADATLPSAATARTPFPAGGTNLTLAPCAPEQLCLHGDRFHVEVTWRDFRGATGTGVGQTFSPASAWFWFFRQGNPELLLKILDGGPVNDHWWVFYGALSNVEFDITVTDRATNRTATYFSPLGDFAARGDTTALRMD